MGTGVAVQPVGPLSHRTATTPHLPGAESGRRRRRRAGALGTLAWLVLFGLLGGSLVGYVWWTLLAGVLAWLTALVMVGYGDRGVAAGIAIVTAGGWSIATAAVVTRWMSSGDWPLW